MKEINNNATKNQLVMYSYLENKNMIYILIQLILSFIETVFLIIIDY